MSRVCVGGSLSSSGATESWPDHIAVSSLDPYSAYKEAAIQSLAQAVCREDGGHDEMTELMKTTKQIAKVCGLCRRLSGVITDDVRTAAGSGVSVSNLGH